jgi:hypothetical protein
VVTPCGGPTSGPPPEVGLWARITQAESSVSARSNGDCSSMPADEGRAAASISRKDVLTDSPSRWGGEMRRGRVDSLLDRSGIFRIPKIPSRSTQVDRDSCRGNAPTQGPRFEAGSRGNRGDQSSTPHGKRLFATSTILPETSRTSSRSPP